MATQRTIEILIAARDRMSNVVQGTIRTMDDLAASARRVEQQEQQMRQATTAAGVALVGLGAAGIAVAHNMMMVAARNSELGTVLRVLGQNAGYTEEQISGFEERLTELGITTGAARQALLQMIQANMSLADSTQLARLAQDAAVIAQLNSSEAFERLITVVQRGEPVMARTLGLNVDFQASYQRMADELGVTVGALTEQQRMQARVNEVMSAGESIAGAYEAAMTEAGKAMRSLERHVEEAKAAIGEAFLPVLAAVVETVTGAFQWFNALDDSVKRAAGSFLLIGSVMAIAAGKLLVFAANIGPLLAHLSSLGSVASSAAAGIQLMHGGASLAQVSTLGWAAALGPVALALAAVAASAVALNEIVRTGRNIQAGHTQVSNDWAAALGRIAGSSSSATAAAAHYAQAQYRVLDAHREGGIVADIFVNRQRAATAETEDLQRTLLSTATSYEDYAAGVALVNEEHWRLFGTYDNMGNRMAPAIEAISEAEWELVQLTQAVIEAGREAEQLPQVYSDAGARLHDLAEAAQAADGAMGGAAGSASDLDAALSRIARENTVDTTALALFEMARAAGLSGEALFDLGRELGLITDAQYEAIVAMDGLAVGLANGAISADAAALALSRVVAASGAIDRDARMARAGLDAMRGGMAETASEGGAVVRVLDEIAARASGLHGREIRIPIAYDITTHGQTPVGTGATPFQTGAPYIPRNMPAYLHQGEAVLNPREAEAYRAGLRRRMDGGAGETTSTTIDNRTFNVTLQGGADNAAGAVAAMQAMWGVN